MEKEPFLTPEKVAEVFTNLAKNLADDPEQCHLCMDAVLLTLLSSLGYEEAAQIFRKTTKWYA